MWPVTQRFIDAMKQSHKIATRVEVLELGNVIHEDLTIEQGFVRADANNEVRRSCTVRLKDPKGELVPETARELLHPASAHELKVYRGIQYTDSTEDLVPQGVFRISKLTVDDSGEDLSMQIDGYDRSRSIARTKLLKDYGIAAGLSYNRAIRLLLDAPYYQGFVSQKLDFEFDFEVTEYTTTTQFFTTGWDPWKQAVQMASAIGMDLFFDQEGRCVLRSVPDPTGDPDWIYEEGPENTALYYNRTLDDDEAINFVIVLGQGGSFGSRGDARDLDPTSATYVYGPYGIVSITLQKDEIKTDSQARAAALGELRRRMGIVEGLRYISTVNPALDVGDVVLHTRPRSKLQDRKYVLDVVQIPLEPEQPMNCVARERRLVGAA